MQQQQSLLQPEWWIATLECSCNIVHHRDGYGLLYSLFLKKRKEYNDSQIVMKKLVDIWSYRNTVTVQNWYFQSVFNLVECLFKCFHCIRLIRFNLQNVLRTLKHKTHCMKTTLGKGAIETLLSKHLVDSHTCRLYV